jgi:WD40 repeat protein
VWDEQAADFDQERTTALPPSLRGRFSEEPRFIDFSWARTEQHISLRHTLFRDRVADLAAPLHHRRKDDLVGEEIRQYRRTLLLARSTVVLLTVLSLLAGGFAVRATNAANQERRQRERAEAQLRLATARQLVAQADAARDDDPRAALLLGIAAQRIHGDGETYASLVDTLTGSHYAATLTGHTASVYEVAFAPDGRTLATSGLNETVLWDLSSPAGPRPSTGR